MGKYLPTVVFLLCIVIAVILAFSFAPWWPASVAIVIAGAALSLGLHNLIGMDMSPYERELAHLRRDNKALRKDVTELRTSIDELADFVEQVATDVSAPPRVDALPERAASHGGAGSEFTDAGLIERVALLEARLGSATTREDASPATAEAIPEPSQNAPSGDLRDLMARGSEKTNSNPPEHSVTKAALPVRLSPIFLPELGAPVSFLVSAENSDHLEDLSELFQQAAGIANQLESAGRDVGLFVRLSAANLASEVVRSDVLGLIDSDAALRNRMTLMTPQDGFTEDSLVALSAFAGRGCRFALSDVYDWSLNLAALSKVGLAYIAVDGPKMVESARSQGGDPRRLAEALNAHNVELIAEHVSERSQIDEVRTLNPALVAGEGLGASRVVESVT